jgi:hypothetical protein
MAVRPAAFFVVYWPFFYSMRNPGNQEMTAELFSWFLRRRIIE